MKKIPITVTKKPFQELRIRDTELRVYSSGRIDRFHKRWDCWRIVKVKPDKKGYLRIEIDGKTIRCNRIVYYAFNRSTFDLFDSKVEIDHKNRDKTDNCITNLRIATHGQNVRNRKTRSDNRCGEKNISPVYIAKGDYWCWKITVQDNGKKHTRKFRAGSGPIPEILPPIPQEVKETRNDMLDKHHGEFANYGN